MGDGRCEGVAVRERGMEFAGEVGGGADFPLPWSACLAPRRTCGSTKPPQDYQVRQLEGVECSIDVRLMALL
jgi:hypothetical protein